MEPPESLKKQDMPLKKLKEEKPNLTMMEILHLLSKHVKRGRDIPQSLTNPPWRVPAEAHPKSEDINYILNKSMEAQSSWVPECHGKGDFSDFILSNSSLAVHSLLKLYLEVRVVFISSTVRSFALYFLVIFLKVALNVDSEVMFGILLWDQEARESSDDYEGTPHVWLDVLGHDIDNANVDIPESGVEYFYRAKSGNSYRREDPLKSNLKVYLGQDTQTDEHWHSRLIHNMKIFKDFTKAENSEKFLVFSMKHCDLNPTVAMFDILMKEFLANQYSLSQEKIQELDLARKWSSICWSCMKDGSGQDLKTCSECKTAKYCDAQCQKLDWKIHKLLHKELEHTRLVLNVE